MARKVDKEVLVGFIEEGKGYLPVIRQRIKTFQTDPERLDAMEEAHRHVHTIKGASSMVGLAGLSHMAYYVEETLEEIAAGQLDMSPDAVAFLRKVVDQIEGYLDGVLGGTLRERPIVEDVTRAYRRLHGLPVEEDDAALQEVFAEMESAPEVIIQDAQKPAPVPPAPARPSPAPPVEMTRYEEVSPELLEAFSLEAEDHLCNVSSLLATLNKQPEDREAVQDIRRNIHTLKGAAGAVGLRAVAQLAHQMEDLLDLLFAGSLSVVPDVMDLLFDSTDALVDMATAEVEEETVQATLQDLYDRFAAWVGEAPVAQPVGRKLAPLGEEAIIDLAELAPRFEQAGEAEPAPDRRAAAPAPRKPTQVVRVPIERLDELVKLVSELVISRTTFEQRMADFERTNEELQLSVERLRRVSLVLETQYEVRALGGRFTLSPLGGDAGLPSREPMPMFNTHGFDELEFDRYTEFHRLSRELTETTSDINTIGNELIGLSGDFDSILNRQGRLSSELQDKLMRTRMVPLATLATRLHRAVRVLAREQSKQVDLVIEGDAERVELDKTVLEEMADPLLHLLRNAVDHGIEPSALRQVMGKPERGIIRLRAYHEGNQVVIQVSDDGAGLEPQLLRAAAVAGGYVSSADALQLSDEELRSLIFLPGFSTAGEVSEVSGRGVGLDIVKTSVHKLKGTVALDSTVGQGATFTIRLPMTMAVTRALMVRAHNESFAIPLDAVTQIVRLEREEIERVGQEPVIRVGGKVYPLLRLGEVLNLKQPADETVQRLPVLILNAEGQRVALVVDQLVSGREIVIKTLGNHLRRVHGVTGATLMGDGSVVLILNPSDLVSEPAQPASEAWTAARAAVAARETLSVMIVDDSMSVRRVVSNLIQSAGWQPVAARDGLEALEMVHRSAKPPDLILLDIEMPRMDGYEFMATLKGQEAYRGIPIVVLTSRAGEKHRRKALDLGASEYVVKPYQDEALLGTIRRLVQESRSMVPA
jgi:chemosensory pili system protein ChpA (sensor histidine kinase/response regulator)